MHVHQQNGIPKLMCPKKALWIQGWNRPSNLQAEMLEEEDDFDAAFLVNHGSSKDHQTKFEKMVGIQDTLNCHTVSLRKVA